MATIIKNSRKLFETKSETNISSSGSGISIVDSPNQVKSIIEGNNISIIDNGDSITINSLSDDIQVVSNYSSLPSPASSTGKFYWCENSQGTKWLPGSLGGTYYSSGLYYSNGTTWEFIDIPYQATQTTVNTGTNTDQFITPSTLNNYSGWNKTKVGLGNVDNTSDINKPISTATATALANKTNRVTTTVDNQIVRFDGVSGDQQGSSVTIDDNGGIIVTGVAGSTFTAKKIEYDTTINQWIAYDNDSNVAMNLGYEVWVIAYNNTGSTITNGQVVNISGAVGGIHSITLAQANSGSTTVSVGFTTESIANGSTGKVTIIGLVNGVNTSTLSAGTVYLSATVAGGLTNTAPLAPNYRMRVGFVGVISATVGTILAMPSTASLGNGNNGQVLGISSGIQAYLNANQIIGYQGYPLVMPLCTAPISPVDGQTYYYGIGPSNTAPSTALQRKSYIPKSGTIKSALVFIQVNTILASSETCTVSLRLNNTTDYVISSTATMTAAQQIFSITGLNISVTELVDYVEGKIVCPIWATNPTNIVSYIEFYIE